MALNRPKGRFGMVVVLEDVSKILEDNRGRLWTLLPTCRHQNSKISQGIERNGAYDNEP
jgi:hypothetical protein